MTNVVVDASAGVEMALRSRVGRRLRAQLPKSPTLWVPEHYFAEAGAVLRRLEINDLLSKERIQLALNRLLAQPSRRVSVRPITPEAWAMRHNLTLADALYVVVAQHLDAPLVTTDRRLTRSPTLTVATITP